MDRPLRGLSDVSISTCLSAPWFPGLWKNVWKIVWTENITPSPQKCLNMLKRGSCLQERFWVLFSSQVMAASWRASILSLLFGVNCWDRCCSNYVIFTAATTYPRLVAKCHFHALQCMVCNYNLFTIFFVKEADAFRQKGE